MSRAFVLATSIFAVLVAIGLLALSGCLSDDETDVRPDLVVTLGHTPESPTEAQTITFSATVKNQGSATADPSWVELKVGGESDPPAYEVPELAPGAEYTVSREEELIAQGYLNTATADCEDDVVESDETNNVTSESYEVVVDTNQPDLQVTSLTHAPLSPATTDTITFTAVISNAGTATADASTLEFRVGGESTPATYAIPSLAAGATHTVQRQEVLNVAQN